MRVGNNPNKDLEYQDKEYFNQIIMPVYIPYLKEYFKEALDVLKLSLNSIFATVHTQKTYITIVNNGSCNEVVDYLNELHAQNKIQEIIHTENIGKLNAILKGLAGSNIPIVTITDSDVLFLSGWQHETFQIFNSHSNIGVVGLTPQFKMFETNVHNLIFDTLFSKKVKFEIPQNPQALVAFYKSLGWKDNYNKDYLHKILTLQLKNKKVCVGSGHFVASYRRTIFEENTSYIAAKMGAGSENYLDEKPLKKGYWRVTTFDNFAYHLGNSIEEWMLQYTLQPIDKELQYTAYKNNTKQSKLIYILKNKLFARLFKQKWIRNYYYKIKGLSPQERKEY